MDTIKAPAPTRGYFGTGLFFAGFVAVLCRLALIFYALSCITAVDAAFAETEQTGIIKGEVLNASKISIVVLNSKTEKPVSFKVKRDSSFNPARYPEKGERVEVEYKMKGGRYRLLALQIPDKLPEGSPRKLLGDGIFRTNGEIVEENPRELTVKEDVTGLEEKYEITARTTLHALSMEKGEKIIMDFRPTLEGNVAVIVNSIRVRGKKLTRFGRKGMEEGTIEIVLSDIKWLTTGPDEPTRFAYDLKVMNFQNVPVRVIVELTLKDEEETELGTAQIEVQATPNGISQYAGTGKFRKRINTRGLLKSIKIRSIRLK